MTFLSEFKNTNNTILMILFGQNKDGLHGAEYEGIPRVEGR